MMAPDLHTPLESFLLFQTLHPFSDNNPPSFVKVSEALKRNDQLRETDALELDRLEPDSLKSLYLRLLKEEAKAETGRQQPQENPRKRKLSSPPLETMEEALQYSHLLPQLVNRLYFRYREHAIESIKDEERKYRSLQREIQEMERQDSRGVSSIKTLLRHDDEGDKPRAAVTSRPTSSQDHQLHGPNPETNTAGAVINGYVPGPQAPTSGEAYGDQKHGQKPGSTENGAPFLPPMQHHGYPMGSPSSEINRRLLPPNQSQSHPAPLPSPRSNQTPLPRPERSSASPIVLPGPQGLLRSSVSGSQTGPLDALADMAGQQYRASPTVPPSRPVQHTGSQQHPHQLAPPQNYMQRPYPYYDNQSPYPVAYSQYGQNYSQHHGAMPPYQGPLGSPGQGSPYPHGQHYPSQLPSYSQHPGYNQSPGYYQQSAVHTPYARGKVSRFADLHTPMSNASGRQRPPRPSPILTSASSTRWKDTPGSVRQPSPVRPSVSPISEKAPSPSPESRTRGTRNQKTHPSSTDSPGEGAGAKSTRRTQFRTTAKRGRRGRAGSVASSTVANSARARTRSHSVASQTDETVMDNQPSSTRKIKPEPSGTSVHEDDTSIASHTADEGSRKSTRQRRGTIRGLEITDSTRTTIKRKREDLSILPPSSPSPAPSATVASRPGYVLGTRNFPRISATIMNDILANKVANVFGRPLTEREAPGYKDLVSRPQDLKSIKAAINAGAKALVAAAENIEDVGTSSTVWIPETIDVVPPKGIINSAQLEKELMRMFANAIMYNPDLPTNRGFGSAMRTRLRTAEKAETNGGNGGADDDNDSEEQEVVEKGKEDVSVVKDAREMFEAVEPHISEWRNAERAAEEPPLKGPVARLRGGSGALEDVDEMAGEEEEVLGTVEQETTPEPEPRAKRRRR
ncbi:hypothetical protein OEA41_006394 [Lepraria neglecta]|uniref:Bromo domain-containing protein n=1 Tax=Lepraria neglecta TaxID=209136 RepID=A0AAE0DKW5_9LECA|nr:hypothetical protein OEA41_006394 [Lepraria neglecta]